MVRQLAGLIESRFQSPLRTPRTAAILGAALGVSFAVCFATGLLSHLVQDSSGWFRLPARPAGFYRVTQGLHVATGIATIPLLLAKLWSVFPKLFEWPPVRSGAHALERLAILPLVGGSLFLLVSGVGNIDRYRPWAFDFRSAHYAIAWITIGALVVHLGAKWSTTRDSLRRPSDERTRSGHVALAVNSTTRRTFIGSAFGVSALLTLVTVGQTFAPLRKLALLAPRRPDIGPQGFPVNRTAAAAGTDTIDIDAYRLVIDGPLVDQRLELSYAELASMPQRSATLPIACVEGWSTTQTWTGVRFGELLARAGVRSDVHCTVHSIQTRGLSRSAPVNASQAADADTLVALRVNGDMLAADHGFPVRLIGPNRPGVHQTKWLGRVEVHG